MTIEKLIKSALKEKKAVIGSKGVLKCIRRGDIEIVICTSNCPDTTKKDLNNFNKINKFKIEEFKGDSVKLGEVCGKPFNILLFGVKK